MFPISLPARIGSLLGLPRMRPQPVSGADRIGAGPAESRRAVLRIAVLFAVLGFAAFVLGTHYDKFWWPPDEGGYAHRADRIVGGEVLNRDVQDIRPGLVNFFHALVFRVVGDDLVSLRYPLVVAGLVQAVLIFLLFAPRGLLVAATASMSLTSLSYVQFLNPAANWYSLFLLIVIVCILAWVPRDRRGRLELVGFLVVTLLLFRQLSGVFVAIGVLTYLIGEGQRGADRRDRIVGRGLIAVMAAGLAYYLATKADALTIALFGIWPLAILARSWFAVADNRSVARLCLKLGVGGVVPLVPLVAYHVVHGSLASWIDDTILHAIALTNLDFIARQSYGFYMLGGVIQVAEFASFAKVVNGAFWMLLPAVPAVQGLLAARSFGSGDPPRAGLHPLPFLAVFYALVSIHYQIPIYLFYTVGLSGVALLWTVSANGVRQQVAPLLCACALSAVALYFHAAQPVTRGQLGILAGERRALVPGTGIERSGLWVEAADRDLYAHLIDLIRREVPPDGTIFALPANPELYFLARRRNPFRFFNSGIGVRSDDDLAAVARVLRHDPPGLVLYRPVDKYNTAFSGRIMEVVRRHYTLLETRGGFEIYRPREDSRSGATGQGK